MIMHEGLDFTVVSSYGFSLRTEVLAKITMTCHMPKNVLVFIMKKKNYKEEKYLVNLERK